MDAASQEGWYTDPYGRHEARWLSEGRPTKLVRDAGVEAYDEPPDVPPTEVPTRIEEATTEDGGDLRRADDPESDSDKVARAIVDAYYRTTPSW
jgi:hypothetical protein